MKRIFTGLLFALVLQSAIAQQWIPLNPNPTGNDLGGVQMFSTTSGYMVGGGGTILTFDGTDWVVDHTFPFSEDLNAMYFLSETNGWVATDQGSILHYDGTTWTSVFSDPSIFFLSIHLSGPDNGWAVGGDGAVVKFDGTSWVAEEPITDAILWSVYCWDATHVWAGGNQELFFYNGIEWEAVEEGAPCSFMDFHFNSLNDGVVYTNQALVYTYNGSTWTQVPLNDGGFDDVEVVSSTDIWAVDDLGSIWHSDGTTWVLVEEEIIPNYGWFTGLDFADATHGWAVGSGGAIYQYDGVAWTRYSSGFTNSLTSMDGSGGNDVWITGDEGFLDHFDGTVWDTVGSPTDNSIATVDVLNSNDAWAVSSDYTTGEILHYNGQSWTIHSTIQSGSLNDICMLNPSLGWLCTGQGKLYKFDGTSWTQNFSATDGHFYSIGFASENDGWAGGYCENKLYHYNGTVWTAVSIPGLPDNFNCGSFHFVSPTNGWVVGGEKYSSDPPGYILHYDGTAWTVVMNLPHKPLNSVWIVNDTLGWAVGDGDIYKFNGTAWLETEHNVTGEITDVYFSDPSTGWICGGNGLLYKYNPNYVPVGVKEPALTEQAELAIYPNPTIDEITLKMPVPTGDKILVEIFDMQGTRVKNLTTANYHLSVANLPAGLYLIRATAGNGRIYSSRFLKK